MSIETTADRLAFMEVFGIDVVVNGNPMKAIYDDPHFETLEMSTSTPMLTVATSDVSGLEFDDVVTITSISFTGRVRDIQNDGTGITVLMLKDV